MKHKAALYLGASILAGLVGTVSTNAMAAAKVPAPASYSDTPYSTFVDLGWSAVSGSTEYHYQVEQGSTLVANSDTTATHASVTGLSSSTSYKWRVSSLTPNGSWTGWVKFKTQAASTPPSTKTCTAAPGDQCGPYSDPSVYYSNKTSDYVANQSLASTAADYKGNLTATGLGSWTADLTVKNNQGGVEGYPAADNTLASPTSPYNPQPVANFSDMSSAFASTFPHTSGTSAESGYDVWTDPAGTNIYNNGWNQETMIWTDQYDRFNNSPSGAPVACGYDSGAKVEAQNVDFNGQEWDLCLYGTAPGKSGANTNDNSEWIWYLPGTQEDSGTVDIQAMINYEISHGYLPGNIGYTQINYGFEVCSTSGAQDFTVSKFTLTSTSS